MDRYLDIRLLPDPEVAPAHLMNALFAKLHHALVTLERVEIGISFPDAVQEGIVGLGHRLRLHGTAMSLPDLMERNWLLGMRDHVQLGEVAHVPASAGHQFVRRMQVKSNPERLRRRQMKRKGWTEEQARAAIPDSAARTLQLPYLVVQSQSTGQQFRLFVDHRPTNANRGGSFNAYGLSTTASLPFF